ncbi:unnamed protein product [Phytomonas sp. EM1]|nr:unnamed protein product [Phytomonas sp. EM1]|eukprot:CCW64330.1 unnamed protein product [Phytomonas sp. isolate EM1]
MTPVQSVGTVTVDTVHAVALTLNGEVTNCSSPGAALRTQNLPTNAADVNYLLLSQSGLTDTVNIKSSAVGIATPSIVSDSNEEEPPRPVKMNRIENPNVLAPRDASNLTPSATDSTVSKRLVCTAAPYCDDEDELDLLLGEKKAQEVKRVDALMSSMLATSPTGRQLINSNRSCPEGDSFITRPISSLLWGTRSNSTARECVEYFKRQFEYELRANRHLFDSFEPFFRDKVLRRIESDSGLRPVFPKAPAVSAADIAALPGYALRDYQLAGVQFLLENFHRGMSCILSDDMGLGKTAQIASFLHVLKTIHSIDGPHLIVTPLSTLTNWTRELARWAPGVRLIKYHGERRAREQARMSHHNRHAVLVTTPALLNQDRGFFRKRSWVAVIIDEAHVLKGRDTQITTTARKLTACIRIAVTGTPVHNNVREVWSLMGFLYPSFTAGYDSSITRNDDDAMRAAESSVRLLSHIMLRRTKESLELGIPPRVDEPVTLLEPSYVQSQLLAQLTARALEGDESARRLQTHLSHQRAVCNHPMSLRLLASEGRGQSSTENVEGLLRLAGIPMSEAALVRPSAKMVFLDGLLKQRLAGGHRCLIFSNFTSTLDMLEGLCRLRGYSYERLDGSCNRVERELSMLRYNAPASSCFVFLATTTAGGVGVTLTGADTVILFDAHFNPQLDRQAADRAHRIGQTRVVHVYRLCLKNTVEEHIREIADRKASLGDYIVDGARRDSEKDSHGFSTEDIRQMFRQMNKTREKRGDAVGMPQSTDSIEANVTMQQNYPANSVPIEDDIKMVKELIRVEMDGLERGWVEQHTKQNALVSKSTINTTHHCFVCGGIMHPLEPLYHCVACPKAYHAECLGLKKRKSWETPNHYWSCPRHVCSICSKSQAADGAIFMCVSCPRSFCFDCLDTRYLAIDENGSQLLHIQRTYRGMEEEGVALHRSCYYISCLHCCGVASSSSSSSEESEEDDGEISSGIAETLSDCQTSP